MKIFDTEGKLIVSMPIDDTPVDGSTDVAISSNWAADHVSDSDPHTGYRLESADHTHASTGAQAGQLDHGAAIVAASLLDDDHTIYIKHSLATAINDMLMASGAGVFIKKTLAEVKTALAIAADIATHAALTATHGVAGTIAGLADIVSAIGVHAGEADPHTGYLKESDLDDTAGGTDGATTKAATSNIVYDGLLAKIPKSLLTEQGDIIYASAASTPAALAHGTAGDKLSSGGHAANPSWLSGYIFVPISTQFYCFRSVTVSDSPRTGTVSSVLGQVITLTAGVAYKFWQASMLNNAKVLIWNTTRAQSRWVTTSSAVNKLTVEGDITTWALNDNLTTAYDGATSTFIQIRTINAQIPATAKALAIQANTTDSGTIATGCGLLLTPVGGLGSYYVSPQVTSISNKGYGICLLDSNLDFLVVDNATGTDTISNGAVVIGYYT